MPRHIKPEDAARRAVAAEKKLSAAEAEIARLRKENEMLTEGNVILGRTLERLKELQQPDADDRESRSTE